MVLDKEQTAAASHFKGPMLLLAGPGSGKTTVLTSRIFHLIDYHKVQPSSILVLTFTKEAALSMQKKFIKISRGNIDGYSDVVFGTFHSVFLKILLKEKKYADFKIVTGTSRMKLLRESVSINHIDYSDSAEALDRLSGDISFMKNTGRSDFEKSSALSDSDFLTVFHEYEDKKKRLGLFDFDDMLTATKELLSTDPALREKICERFTFILVDEAQDMNALQFDIIRLISGREKNVFMVGDDDQSIYGFRGADPSYMLDFKKLFPQGQILYLNSNYRCPKEVVEKSLNLISYNKNRFEKQLISKSKTKGMVTYHIFDDDEMEAVFAVSEIRKSITANESVAVLIRHRLDGEKVRALLQSENIPFFPGTASKEEEKKFSFEEDIVSYFRLTQGVLYRRDLLEVINKPDREIPRKGIEDEIVDREKWLSYFERDISVQRQITQFLSDIDLIGRLSPAAAFTFICDKMGYRKYLLKEASLTPDALEEKIDSFREMLKNYHRIDVFLEDYAERKKSEEKNEDTKAKKSTAEDNVFVYTFHGSKGLEFDKIIILSVNDGIVPSNKAVTEKDREEERRMFYVALTRAKKKAIISCVKKRGSKELLPSIYLKETLKPRTESR